MNTMDLQTKPHPKTSQAGMVSIMVTMILMIVISLIVLGFAQVSRRNQRQTLDRQLSTQAFYAAETGVNDAHKLVSDAVASGSTVYEKPDCTNGSGAAGLFYSSLSPNVAAGVSYSCVMVDPTPTSLQYSNISTTSTIVPLASSSGATINTLQLQWQSKQATATPTTNCPTDLNNEFVPVANWACGYGILRIDLVPTSGNFNQSSLLSSTMTSFFVPFRSGGSSSVGFAAGNANANNLRGVTCTNSNCTMSITGLSSTSYHMRVSSLYKDAALQITASNSASGALELAGAQALIDSTGKAQDVLRRIQVRVPLAASSRNNLPDYALETTDAICKRFAAMNGYFNSDVSGVTSTPTNPLCQP